MKKTYLIFVMAAFLLIIGCIQKTGDVLSLSDGQIIEGELQSINNGRIVFTTGAAEVASYARVWLLDGSTFTGDISYNSGFVESGSNSVPNDSIYRIIWLDTEIIQQVYEIDATAGWVDTEIVLGEGDLVSISATGTVLTETGTSTPSGQDKFSSSVALVPAATSGQLVFRVGEESLPVAAGSSWLGESPSSGVLQFAVNIPVERSLTARGVYAVSVISGSGGTLPGDITLFPAH